MQSFFGNLPVKMTIRSMYAKVIAKRSVSSLFVFFVFLDTRCSYFSMQLDQHLPVKY